VLRTRNRRPRRPRVYRIPVEVYLAALALAVALSVAFSILAKPREIDYRLPHRFGIHDPEFLPSAHALADPVMIAGNRVTVLENGDAFFPAMLDAIRGARETINFESYIFWSGSVASRFRDALAEQARRGVEVRLLLDAVGSGGKLDETDVETMRSAGCSVAFFHPLRPWMLDMINHRNHRRLLVVDGKVGFTGGAGVADVWQGNADAKDHWRETQVKVEGPVVAQLQAAFQENWSEVRGEALVGSKFFPALERAGPTVSQVVGSTWRTPSSASKFLYSVAISAARRRVWLSNSYFLPDSETCSLLVDAARRGVDVKIIVPGQVNDVPATKAGGRASFGQLLAGGVKIYEYQPTMFHPKTLVVDGLFSTVGSTNFDHRSFRLNDEINLTMYDADVAVRMEQLFEKDVSRSRRYTDADYRSRSIRERFFEWLVIPFRREL
jgi:cardiolipin synthase